MSDRELFLEFQKKWSLERVKNMTLKEYTQKGLKDTFCYWIEWGLKEFGNIGGYAGGLSNLKFAISHCGVETYKVKKPHLYSKDGQYTWLTQYYDKDDNPYEAFKVIKEKVIDVIEASQNNDLERIERNNLPHLFKWKIAFHYQNPDNIKIVCIFGKTYLCAIAKKELNNPSLKPYQIYQKLLEDKTYSLEQMIEEKSIPLSKEYIETDAIDSSNNYNNEPSNSKTSHISLNQILYGPPGTGKTYNTINKALEILLKNVPKSREEQTRLFKEFKEKRQIEFITFHQNYSYEEFIEGIKPDMEKDDVTYELKDGIFKDICKKALDNYQNHSKTGNDKNKIDAKELFQAYALKLKQKLDEGQSLDFLSGSKMKIQSIFYKGNGEVSIGIGVNKDKNSMQTLTQKIVLRDYENFKNGHVRTYKDIKPTYESQSQWHGNAVYYFELYRRLKDFEQKEFKNYANANREKVELKPYILIIDEINRGNISKIFGELITLIEPSKRIGANEELQVTLPYSNESFGVPKNLYIIGTMNTADRSIALIDTALRRRFEFIEMMPVPELLPEDCGGVKLKELLRKMNERIEFLLDREHTLGHAFLIDAKSPEDLKKVFQNKIIPLLQEYFYEDYARIDAVLNGNGMVRPKRDLSFEKLFDKGKFSDFDNEKIIYEITDWEKWDKNTFERIYLNAKTNQENNEN